MINLLYVAIGITSCMYKWVTREVLVSQWMLCRVLEVPPIREILNPDYFTKLVGETDYDAMCRRRDKYDNIMSMGGRILKEDVSVHDIAVDVGESSIPVKIYVPSTPEESKGVLLWISGGGWIFGSVVSSDPIAKDLSEATGMIVVSVGYRKSPEFKFPIPVTDTAMTVMWTKENIHLFGGDCDRMSIVGESSGANLAISTALLVGDSVRICSVVAASPPVSYAHAMEQSGSYSRFSTGYGLTGSSMKAYWDSYLLSEEDGKHPLVSPINAPTRMLKRLPPILLVRNEYEVLRDEIGIFGDIVSDAGIIIENMDAKGCIHGSFIKGRDKCGIMTLDRTSQFIKEYC